MPGSDAEDAAGGAVTVGELIAKLEQFSGDTEVFTALEGRNGDPDCGQYVTRVVPVRYGYQDEGENARTTRPFFAPKDGVVLR